MKKLIIGVDVDGVLANFNRGFAILLGKLTGKKLVDPETIDPQVWDWPQAVGYNDTEITAAWKYVEQSRNFWMDLHRLPHVAEFLSALNASPHDVYFVTARPGINAKEQTEIWLKSYYGNPTVLITSAKGLAARTLKLGIYIDDRKENCQDVAVTGSRVYMPRTGYNGHGADIVGVNAIGSILSMLDCEGIPYFKAAAA